MRVRRRNVRQYSRKCNFCGRDERTSHAPTCPRKARCERCGQPAIGGGLTLCAPCLSGVSAI